MHGKILEIFEMFHAGNIMYYLLRPVNLEKGSGDIDVVIPESDTFKFVRFLEGKGKQVGFRFHHAVGCICLDVEGVLVDIKYELSFFPTRTLRFPDEVHFCGIRNEGNVIRPDVSDDLFFTLWTFHLFLDKKQPSDSSTFDEYYKRFKKDWPGLLKSETFRYWSQLIFKKNEPTASEMILNFFDNDFEHRERQGNQRLRHLCLSASLGRTARYYHTKIICGIRRKVKKRSFRSTKYLISPKGNSVEIMHAQQEMILGKDAEQVLNKLGRLNIPEGKYFVLPKPSSPVYLLPSWSSKDFKKALSYVKPLSLTNGIKKYFLKISPLFILKKYFVRIDLRTGIGSDSSAATVIIPWKLSLKEKVTAIQWQPEKGLVVTKAGYTETSMSLIRNENKIIRMVKENYHSLVQFMPEVVFFKESDDMIVQTLKYEKGALARSITSEILEFFKCLDVKCTRKTTLDNHPYLSNKLSFVRKYLEENKLSSLVTWINWLFDRYRNETLEIGIMHGDFSTSNVIVKEKGGFVVIDWEYGEEAGIPLDICFYEMKKTFRKSKVWTIQSPYHFMAAFHLIYRFANQGHLDRLHRYHAEGLNFYYRGG